MLEETSRAAGSLLREKEGETSVSVVDYIYTFIYAYVSHER